MSLALMVWSALAAVCVAGALAVIVARDLTRAILGLGAFLLGIAGLYAYYALSFLAVAQVFVYVGGVLVLFLFAITAIRREETGEFVLGRRFDIGAASAAVALFVLIVTSLRPLASAMSLSPISPVGVDALGSALMGGLLPYFEAAGVLLLAALVSAVTISSGGQRR